MKWYWVVSCDNTVTEPFVAEAGSPSLDSLALTSGRAIESWSEDTWLRAKRPECNGEPDDALQNHLGLPIFSKRLVATLDRAGIRGFQYLPVRVMRSDGSGVGSFFVANVLNLAAALDLKHSDYTVFPADYFLEARRGRISALRKPVLVADAIGEFDALRLEEFPEFLFVSDTFRRVFVAGEMTGYSFHEVPVTAGASASA